MEVEADCYAASVIGKHAAIQALHSIALNKKLPLISKFETIKRIARIK